METVTLILAALAFVTGAVLLVLVWKLLGRSREDAWEKMNEKTARALADTRREMAEETARQFAAFSGTFTEQQRLVFGQQDKRLEALAAAQTSALEAFRKTLETNLAETGRRLEEMRAAQEKSAGTLRETVDKKLTEIRQGNEKSIGEIRASVDEKLQTALDEKITRSFKEVSDRLAEVYKGLGEMQNLASGVGDLKKVLSNVKTRGILGEIQLGAILEEILSPEQYETNVATVPRSEKRVEFAVKLPGQKDGETVYLPIDSKFPADSYQALTDAYESGDPEAVKAQSAELCSRIRSFAKDIRDKYVSPPYTTDFAIMFLPTEGLYAEAVKLGMVEDLQRRYKVNIAGPTTMAALLNSLQTGFRTLAIQKRSGEVWQLLSAVKTEFEKFEEALGEAQNRINQASRGLDTLIGVRTRQIRRRLSEVSTLPEESARALLEEGDHAGER